MTRSKGAMDSPACSLLLLAAFSFVICNAGPLPANITSVDLGLKEGSCALGDVVYMTGDEFPGASPCEKCSCSNGGVQCAKERCEPRPGCKAVHRPDHCCPTYQCECEQEGRIYGNGEKVIHPQDSCLVCYCQGGEVVCRRIECFVRRDCRPRVVPGRCCPEYDNCPVSGKDVASLLGMTPSIPNPSLMGDIKPSPIPAQPVEPAKPEITIKEITPVSEIPVITNVKIKEILSSPSIEVAEFSSSKSPLIPREATSEKSPSSVESNLKIDISDTKDTSSSSFSVTTNKKTAEIKNNVDPTPSKISFSTQQDSANNNIFEPKISIITPMMGGPSVLEVHSEPLTTKAPILEEEDLDHNPAFPPIPDDLFLVLSNHDEEVISDQNLDNDHVSMDHDVISVPNVQISTEEPIVKESSGTTIGYVSEANAITKSNISDTSDASESSTYKDVGGTVQPSPTSKENAMLNMRSVISTEILNVPSLISDEVTGDILDVTENSYTKGAVEDKYPPSQLSDTEFSPKNLNKDIQPNFDNNTSELNLSDNTTIEPIKKSLEDTEPGQLDGTLSKSTEIISRTEFSSIPIETSDQNPRETSDKDNIDKLTLDSLTDTSAATALSNSDEINTLYKISSPEGDNQSFENDETTEFILTSFDSHESVTDDVELINVSSDTDESSNIIEPPSGKNGDVLTDIKNLVGDVASISDHTAAPSFELQTSIPTTISDSEELIPVNVAFGYKSKNKNWNLNSITEIPIKSKVAVPITKPKIVEIEDDSDTITDSPPPNDRVEPTTKPPLIDNVSDDVPENNTLKTNRKDIEIITQSYVPTLSRRPTKVVMNKSSSGDNVTTMGEGSSSSDISEGLGTRATNEEAGEQNVVRATETPEESQ